MSCIHEHFRAEVDVHRLEDTGRFMADVRISCSQCGLPFQFLGVRAGLDMNGVSVDLEGTELRIALRPADAVPDPLRQMLGVKKYDG